MDVMRERPGFVIRVAVLALLGIVLVIGVLDAVSIVRARSALNDAAKLAATAAADSYRADRDVTAACEAARNTVHATEPGTARGDRFCNVDTLGGTVRIKLHGTADTILAGRVPFVRRLTFIEARTTAGLESP